MRKSLSRFFNDASGAISAFLVVLLPFLIVLGGVAVDVSQINAQKRDTQALADLAALSAAPLLPDRAAAQTRVNLVLAEARPCAPGRSCTGAIVPKITFLTRSATGALVPAASAATPAVALRVETAQPYKPILMGSLMGAQDLRVTRGATAEKTGSPEGFAGFTLRNQLLSINTRDSILDTILTPLGLGLTVDALGTNGLANARVKLDRLLGLATAGLSVEALTFNDVLQVPIAISELLGVALRDPLGGIIPGYITKAPPANTKVTLADILALSPQLLQLKAGDVLPDVDLGVLDLLQAVANLAAKKDQRIGLGVDLALIDSRLGGASIDLGLIRSHVTGFASEGDLPKPHATLRQTDLSVTVGLLSLVRFDLKLGIAGAEAELVALNCQAREGSDDILAAFDVRTYPLSAYLSIQLLNQNASLDAKINPGDDVTNILATPDAFRVNFTRKAYEAGDLTRDVHGTLSVSELGPALQKLLKNIQIGPATAGNGGCGWNILNCIIGALTGLTAKLVGLVLDVVNVVIPLDRVVNGLLTTLGIDVAGASLTLEHIGCAGENLGPSKLIG